MLFENPVESGLAGESGCVINMFQGVGAVLVVEEESFDVLHAVVIDQVVEAGLGAQLQSLLYIGGVGVECGCEHGKVEIGIQVALVFL